MEEPDFHPLKPGPMEKDLLLFSLHNTNRDPSLFPLPSPLNGHPIQPLPLAQENGTCHNEAYVQASRDMNGFSVDNAIQIGTSDQLALLNNGVIEAQINHGRRKVRWNDSFGKELVEVHEFEPSDAGDSEEYEDDTEPQSCTCVIQ